VVATTNSQFPFVGLWGFPPGDPLGTGVCKLRRNAHGENNAHRGYQDSSAGGVGHATLNVMARTRGHAAIVPAAIGCNAVLRGLQPVTTSVTLIGVAIQGFRHKGLERFFATGAKSGIQAKHAHRLRLVFDYSWAV